MGRVSQTVKDTALQLYLEQWSLPEIAEKTGVSLRYINDWVTTENWQKYIPVENPEIILSRRILQLTQRDKKTPQEIAELEALCRAFSEFGIANAKADKIHAEASFIKKHGSLPSDLPTNPSSKKAKNATVKKTKAVKNDISEITEDMLMKLFHESVEINGNSVKFFSYQQLWYEQLKLHRRRFILKSRQIGATFYFAYEAFMDAVLRKRNKIFLSASRDQANVFKSYIVAFAKTLFEIELKGSEEITLSNGAILRFLSTNSTTAQSYTGDLYIDEVFWIPQFEKINKVASGMASHKKWHITYFSTPSAKSHQAYSLWSGEKHNAKLSERLRKPFDISHEGLKNGAVYADKIWRHIVTVEDAERMGCDLFDIEQLKLEYSTNEFLNLFMCEFIDDSQSVFNLSLLEQCFVDGDSWKDYEPKSQRPYGNKNVSFGFDPAYTGDGSALAITDIPTPDKPFRLLYTHKFYGKNYTFQANEIRGLVQKHNVQFFGADNTGGTGVTMCEKIQEFYPMVTLYHYSPQIKSLLIGKMLDLMTSGRFKYLACQDNVTRAFLLIKQSITTNTGAATYITDRVVATDVQAGFTEHGDLAWAIMHACQVEPIAKKSPSTLFVA